MKEYEYVIQALEEYLCDELTGVICTENYRNRSYEHGYRKLFVEYRKLHEDFEKNKERYIDTEQEQGAREEFKRQCRLKREDVFERFIKDIRSCSEVDVNGYVEKYLEDLEKEEVQTVAKRICVYPYLVSVMRENKEGGMNNDKKF